ncbi:MAG: hypothetical protein KJ749_12625 [Planctomycetes bacterium]|nr:hypothetical protein [Planctomycetota bacterium]
MGRNRRPSKLKRKKPRFAWWTSLELHQRSRIKWGSVAAVLAVAMTCAVAAAMSRLEAHVARAIVERSTPMIELVDMPAGLAVLAEEDLHTAMAETLDRFWMDDQLCRALHERVKSVGWVDRANYVRRTGDGHFRVSCRYRVPTALVQQGGEFYLVDVTGVRLPGTYHYDASWQLVQGVRQPAPPPGARWEGEDLAAGLAIIAALGPEAYTDQITGVLVDNFGGRSDPRRSHIELATDRAGGRIHWGSAPGLELEENSVERKLAILRENYQRTGRADARHSVIDVFTYPDRYSIPG